MLTRSSAICAVLTTLTLGISGCGTDCQSACTKLYGTAPNCGQANGDDSKAEGYFGGLIGPGQTQEKMNRQCMKECENALDKPGDAGDYDPNTYTPATETVTLENDEMAALWMDCVEAQSCENLADGYCSPVW